MKKVTIASYILWAILAILSHFLWANWWITTSFVWFPLLCLISFGAFIFVTSDIGSLLKKVEEKKKAKEPPTCMNCLFGATSDLVNSMKKEGEEKAQCLGEKCDGVTRGQVCPRWVHE